MTSGQFHLVPMDSIIVDRDNRQRREIDPEKLDILKDSIYRLGLIHPIVVTRELELVSGERRYTACRQLGWTNIPAQYTDELDPARLRAIELEENIKRLDITWQDQTNAIREYHRLRASEDPKWTQQDTAEAIGLSRVQTNAYLMVADELSNPRIADLPKFSVAFGIVKRAAERRDNQIISEILGAPAAVPEPQPILTTDFVDWTETHVSPKFNLVHCDFPYGIEANTFNQGAAGAHGGYLDTTQHWHHLMGALRKTTKYHTTDACHLMFWFAMRKGDNRLYETTCLMLEQMGWTINPIPLVWMKSDGVGIIPDPERGPRQIYETCLLGSKGDRKIVRSVANAYASPTVRDKHMSEKPEPMLRHFFGMLVDANTVLLDPTCGSGSALRAAESLGAKYVLGLENNPEFADLARTALNRARLLRRAEKVMEKSQ